MADFCSVGLAKTDKFSELMYLARIIKRFEIHFKWTLNDPKHANMTFVSFLRSIYFSIISLGL